MKINLKDLANIMSHITDLVSGDKQVPGVMFDIGEDKIQVCYTNGTKTLSEEVEAVIGEGDVTGKIIFNYTALNKVIESCKPTGRIITDDIDFIFCANNIIKVRAEKRLEVFDENEELIGNKVASVVEQSLAWSKADSSPRIAALTRENYGLLHHYDLDELNEKFPNPDGPRALETSEWEEVSDKWRIDELKAILQKLSIESGKIVYVAPSLRKAFVQNTSHIICIPFNPLKDDNGNTVLDAEGNEIYPKYKMVQSTSMAKSIATILGKIETDDGIIHTHMIDKETMVFSTEDNKVAISIKNMRQDRNNIEQLNNYIAKDYSNVVLNFNKEVLQSSLGSAKTAVSAEKVTITFEKDSDGVVNMVMGIRNTNSSTDNKYAIEAEYVIDSNETLSNLKIVVTLDVLYQAVSKVESDYVALDVCIDANGQTTVRVAEIDIEKRNDISDNFNIDGPWTTEFMLEHRADMLGYTTYFAAGKE